MLESNRLLASRSRGDLMTLPIPFSLATALAFLTIVSVGSCDFCDSGSSTRSSAPGVAVQLADGAASSAS
jgi:hypothetical protein